MRERRDRLTVARMTRTTAIQGLRWPIRRKLLLATVVTLVSSVALAYLSGELSTCETHDPPAVLFLVVVVWALLPAILGTAALLASQRPRLLIRLLLAPVVAVGLLFVEIMAGSAGWALAGC